MIYEYDLSGKKLIYLTIHIPTEAQTSTDTSTCFNSKFPHIIDHI